MKKIITAMALVLTICSLLIVLGACGEDKEMTNTTSSTENISTTNNPGMVTDESHSGEDGALGEMVTDISEGVSEAMTDVSEGISKVVE